LSVEISIVIVNFNGAHLLKGCINSILSSHIAQQKLEIIVVDNASKDTSLDLLQSAYPQVKCIANEQNKGFSKANNQGAKIAQGKWLFLLNNDTLLSPTALESLLKFAEAQPDAGIIGPQLYYPDGRKQPQGSSLSQFQFWGKQVRKVNFLSGAAMFCLRQRYLEVGGLDENYIFYNEDVDLCKTMQKKGYPLYFLPEIKIVHFGGASSQTIRPQALKEGVRGGLYLTQKHYPTWVYQSYKFGVRLYCLFSKKLYELKGNVALATTFNELLEIIKNEELISPKGHF